MNPGGRVQVGTASLRSASATSAVPSLSGTQAGRFPNLKANHSLLPVSIHELNFRSSSSC